MSGLLLWSRRTGVISVDPNRYSWPQPIHLLGDADHQPAFLQECRGVGIQEEEGVGMGGKRIDQGHLGIKHGFLIQH